MMNTLKMNHPLMMVKLNLLIMRKDNLLVMVENATTVGSWMESMPFIMVIVMLNGNVRHVEVDIQLSFAGRSVKLVGEKITWLRFVFIVVPTALTTTILMTNCTAQRNILV